jgi:hypothetical protein
VLGSQSNPSIARYASQTCRLPKAAGIGVWDGITVLEGCGDGVISAGRWVVDRVPFSPLQAVFIRRAASIKKMKITIRDFIINSLNNCLIHWQGSTTPEKVYPGDSEFLKSLVN